MSTTHVAVIGAGPAGLTAAHRLSHEGVDVTVFEADPHRCGGISRTAEYRGYRFDIGGHRFFSKSKEVEDLWTEILPDDMLVRRRSSRIHYRGKLFAYPLDAQDALRKLGVVEAARCVESYVEARLRPNRHVKSFEDWVVDKFGRRLFEVFFKTYTEKVWGMRCDEISADWAAQRIRGMSLRTAIEDALGRAVGMDRSQGAKSLIQTFRYPRLGPGMLWDACAEKVRTAGGRVLMGERVTALSYDGQRRKWRIHHRSEAGERCTEADHVISTAPIRELIASLTPAPADDVRAAAAALRYRDFIIVSLIVDAEEPFLDQWIYVHDSHVKVARIQNFKSWSPAMVPDPSKSCLGLEYFCFEGDGLWETTDEGLLALARREIAELGLVRAADVVDGCVIRQRKAYPVYDADYATHVETVRRGLSNGQFPNLHLLGRNGMHKYNNQDHSMMTGLLCAANILAGKPLYDVWRVNDAAEYHEEGTDDSSSASGLRLVPARRVDLAPSATWEKAPEESAPEAGPAGAFVGRHASKRAQG